MSSSFTTSRPGAISKNLRRLRDETGLNRTQFSELSGIGTSSLEKFELVYEPPKNHPYLPVIAKALSKALNRDVSKELFDGGKEVELNNHQLARMYQRQPKLAPPGFFKSGPLAGGVSRRAYQTKYSRLIQFLDTDSRVAAIAKQYSIPLPHAKVGAKGQALGTSPRAVRERAYRLQKALVTAGVNLKALMQGAPETPASNGHRPSKDLRSVVYTCVTTFNQRRMQGERTMVMPMDTFETFFSDYLKQSGIASNVLVGSDIAKLVPRNG